ncbi:MAG TPA: zinc-binding dehydrogenase [Candidatus Eisenbacteria bacterium]|nr:zinc-binding dehydrogenase [Candidatus Eisenbacteria bacterium]
MTPFIELCPVRTEAVPLQVLDRPVQAMRAVVMQSVGGPEVLELERVPIPQLKSGEVMVELHARGVNFSETEWRRARYHPTPLPWILGSEGAGVVTAVGPDVDPAWRGHRVAFYAPPPTTSGTYADFATAPAAALLPLPDALDFVTAAAIPQQGLTAWFLVHRAARVRAGQIVLIHAAAGGVGLLAVQLARRLGARVLGTISSEEKSRAVQEAGGEPLLYGDDLPERVRERTGGRGADIVLDSVGLPTQAASLAALAPFGTLIHFGDAGGFPAPVDPNALYERSLRVGAFHFHPSLDPLALAHARHELVQSALDGSLRFRIDRTLPLHRAAEAHRLLESRQTLGKIVLVR